MTWTDKIDHAAGMRSIRILEEAIASGTDHRFADVEGDDSEGRVTGRYVCGVCGMRSFDPDHPETCCIPAMRAAGLMGDGR